MSNNAGGPALLWGYATVITSILIYFGWKYLQTPVVMFGWFLIPVIGGIGMFILNKREQPVLVKTFLDRVINYIWIVFGLVGGAFSISAFLFQIPILFIIGVLMSAGITLTGCVTNFKPYTIGGIAGIAVSFLCLVFPQPAVSLLIFAGVFVIGMIVPGHIANGSGKSEFINLKTEVNQS